MTMNRKSSVRGFTLVEILIVVIILGILAAIVIPQFTNASASARDSSLQSTLQTLRSQIQLYKLQHGDTLPNLVTDWTPMTGTTLYSSTTYGPYMQSAPVNSINGFNGVSDCSGSLTGLTTTTAIAGKMSTTGQGFIYDYEGGAGSGLIYGTDTTGAAVAGVGTTPY